VSDHHAAVSPHSMSGSATSTAYTSNIPARVISPLNQKSMTSLQTGPPDLRVSVPHPHETPSHWQGNQHHMPSSQQYQQQLGSQSARGSWDLSSYLDSNPGTAGGTSTPQTLNYPSTHNNNADSAVSGGDNRLVRSLSSQQQGHQMPRT